MKQLVLLNLQSGSREMIVDSQLSLCILFLRTQPMGWCSLHSALVACPELNLSVNNLIDTSIAVSPR